MFDLSVLLNKHTKTYNKIQNTYFNIYSSCLKKIINSNSFGNTDIIINIPFNIIGCPMYVQSDCIVFVEKLLQDNNFNTLILSNSQLFVSWYDYINSSSINSFLTK